MGAVKTFLVTGAAGFLGAAVVRVALERGHKVRALVRRAHSAPGGEELVCDLAREAPTLDGITAVIHCAARLAGNDAEHAADTLGATARLYDAADGGGVPVVLAGSMAVYPGRSRVIDEETPLEPDLAGRDAYARAKLGQEQIARAHPAVPTRVLRLGAIWEPGRMWNAHLGVRLGPVLIRLAGTGELPLVALDDAARALVLAAEAPPAKGIEVLNVIGDDRPDARSWLARMTRAERPVLTLPVPWQAVRPFALIARLLHFPVPGLLRPATLRYRMAPRCYPNARAKAALGWQPEDAA